MILKVRKNFMVFKQHDLLRSDSLQLTFYTLEVMFATRGETEAALWLFCELGISYFSVIAWCS